MELTKFLTCLAVILPLAFGAPAQVVNNLQPEILAAMKRDLGLNTQQAEERVGREAAAVEVIDQLRTTVGEAFAGAWVSENGKKINIAITDDASVDLVTAAGAHPTVMANSLSKLKEGKKALDKIKQPKILESDSDSHSGVTGWYVDIVSNKVVLEALATSTAYAEELATEAGLAKSEFEVRTVKEIPTTHATVVGGDAYLINNSARCSVGFSVTTGFITAGHCGGAGSTTTTTSGESLGNVAASVFPGDADMAHVQTPGGTVLSPYINGYGGSTPGVKGSNVAPLGSSICRSGSTSGLHCGTVSQYEVTVNYSQGAVSGLTGTDVCCEPGDSGGSFFSGDQAQGVTSGGSGDCTSGGQTFFQPVNEILNAYGLYLITEA